MKSLRTKSYSRNIFKKIQRRSASDKGPPPIPIPLKERLNSLRLHSPVTIGIEMDDNDVRLVKVRPKTLGTGKWELIDFKQVPRDPDISWGSQEFTEFLKTILKDFCDAPGRENIWCSFPNATVDLRYLRIPKVKRAQIPNAVFWTFQKDSPFQESETVFNYQVMGETTENGTPKIQVMAFTAPRKEIDTIKKCFHDAGYPLTGMTPLTFSIQNLLNGLWTQPPNEPVCSLWIGREWSSIDIYIQGKLVLCRSIRAGINGMIEAIKDELLKEEEAADEDVLRMEKQGHTETDAAYDLKTNEQTKLAAQILFHAVDPEAPCSNGLNYSDVDIQRVIRPVFQRLIKQVERTLKHFSLHFNNEVVQKVYMTGPLGGFSHLMDYLKNQLETDVQSINAFDGTIGIVSSERSFPDRHEQFPFTVATGASLCAGPNAWNLLVSHKDKARSEQTRRIHVATAIVFLLIMGALSGFCLHQRHRIAQKQVQIRTLEHQLAQCNPCVTQELILQTVSQVKTVEKALARHSAKLLPVAVVSELAGLTPENIRLVSVSTDDETLEKQKDKNKPAAQMVLLDGIVLGPRTFLDTSLAGYLMRLRDSRLFADFRLIDHNYETLRGQEVLRFKGELVLAES